jgi:hypothetical protein
MQEHAVLMLLPSFEVQDFQALSWFAVVAGAASLFFCGAWTVTVAAGLIG